MQLNYKIEREARGFVSDFSLLVEREERNREKLAYLKERHSLCDRKIVDLEHEVELSEDYTVEEQLEFFAELKRVSKIRRDMKDRVDFYMQVELFYKKGATPEEFESLERRINAIINSKSKRKYTKRVKDTEEI